MGLKKINLPELGEGVTEGEIIKIKVSEGETISMDQALLEVMTDKASMEVPSFIEGTIQKIEVAEGDIVSVGASLFTVKTKGEMAPTESKQENAQKEKTKNTIDKQNPAHSLKNQNKIDFKSQNLSADFALAAPATRKLAEELGLPLTEVKGTGLKGEIKREDLLNHIKFKFSQNLSVSSPSASFVQNGEEEKREPLRGVQRFMFESMTLSKATIPHFTIGDQAQVNHLVRLKTEINNRLEKQGLKTGWLSFFIRALIPVLKEFPIFNSIYSAQTKEIIFRKDLNIGFAMDSPQGLLVPVLKQAQNKSLLEIIKEIRQLAEKTRQGRIERGNLTGAGITLSNLGSLGGLYGTPIINPPEMAIMGIYSLFKQVVLNSQGKFEEKPFINFSITCDHRFIDGATAARFLKSFISKIQEPSLLILD